MPLPSGRRPWIALAVAVVVCLGFAARAPAWWADPVVARRHAVATDHALASDAALATLRAGGNAADAAITAALALGVVAPQASGLGGGGFALVWRARDRSLVLLDFRETAPTGASPMMFVRDGRVVPGASTIGGRAVAVPGEPAGLFELSRRFGRLPLARVAAPAVRLARSGFPVSSHTSWSAGQVAELLRASPLAATFAPGGRPIGGAARLVRPELARTLATFGRQGATPFYRGAIARAIVATVGAAGGSLTADDLAGYRVVERTPVRFAWRSYEIASAPPPSAGGIALAQSLRFLEHVRAFGSPFGSSAYLHAIAESMKGVYADRTAHLGDPAFVTIPMDQLLSDERIRARARWFDPRRTVPATRYGQGEPPRDHGTSHLCTADEEGNVVALTTTINMPFGAMLVAGSTGILLNDEMDDFAAAVGTPNGFELPGSAANLVAPGRRPVSSMSPTIVLGDGAPVLCVGGSGGSRIITAVLQVMLAMLAYDRPPNVAVSAPRIHHQGTPDRLTIEDELSPDVIEALRARGHAIAPSTWPSGYVQAIRMVGSGADRRLYPVSDPRKGGRPAGD
ncbi:MAG: gamma-glutamyltransferase [Deltaproteobacteria bacterium]|nr:gamma-glutamyltransferase [Deltaproteobacteria bacterium]